MADNVEVQYRADVRKLRKDLNKVEKEMEGVEKKAKKSGKRTGKEFRKSSKGVKKSREEVGGLKKQLKTLGPIIAGAFATGAISQFGRQVVQARAQFEKQMSKVQAKSGATQQQFTELSDQAQELGRTTKFSASQAAEGMNFLAQAGFETNEIMDALPGTLELAAAGNLQLGQAADISSNILQAFGKEAKEVGEVNDVLAKTAISANTDVQQLGQAMSFAAPVAKGLGLSVSETSAAIGVFSNRGIQAGKAGRGLRILLTQLNKESEDLPVNVKNANGEMRELPAIFDDLKDTGFTASDAMNTFSARAGTIAQTLLQEGTTEELKALTGELDNAGGTAERVAETQMDNLQGQFTLLQSATKGFQIALGGLASGALSNFVGVVTDAINVTTDWIKSFEPRAAGIKRTRDEVNQLGAEVLSLNEDSEERIEKINELNKLIPKNVSKLDAQTASQEDIARAIREANSAFDEQIRIQAQKEIIQERMNELVEIQREITNRNTQARKAAIEIENEYGVELDKTASATEIYSEAQRKLTDEQQKVVESAFEGLTAFGEIKGAATGAAGSANLFGSSIQDLQNQLEQGREELDNMRNSFLQAETGIAGFRQKIKGMSEQELHQLLNSLEAERAILNITSEKYAEQGRKIDILKSKIESLADTQKENTNRQAQNQTQLDKTTISLGMTADEFKRLDGIVQDTSISFEEQSNAQNELINRQERLQQQAEQMREQMRANQEARSQINLAEADSIKEREQAKIDAVRTRLDRELAQEDLTFEQKKAKEVQAAQEITQIRRDANKRRVDIAKNAISSVATFFEAQKQRELAAAKGNERKQAQIRKKFANKQLAINIAQIIANQALAVSKAFSQLGPIAGTIAAAGVAAAIGAQIAKAKAQKSKVQSFAEGEVDIDGPGTQTSDSIDAKLSKGESVINAEGTKKYKDELIAANEGRLDDFIVQNYVTPELKARDRKARESQSFARSMSKALKENMMTDENIVQYMHKNIKENRKNTKRLEEKLEAISRKGRKIGGKYTIN